MKILFLGDIFGKPGRRGIEKELKKLRDKHQFDLVIANAENTTHGKSISENHLNFLEKCGIDFFTMGNHTWDRLDIHHTLNTHKNIIRPYNVDGILNSSGVGTKIINVNNIKIRITNLIGRTCYRFNKTPNPFLALDKILTMEQANIHIVDFHTEATGEKCAMALDFDGKITALFGTHTHVQTADERILAKGTAFITDVGMCGAKNGVIGAKAEVIINKQRNDSTFILEVSSGPYMINGVILDISNKDYKVKTITRLIINEDK